MQQWKTDTSRSCSTNLPKIQITKFAHPNRSSEGLPFFKCKAPLFIQPPWSSGSEYRCFHIYKAVNFNPPLVEPVGVLGSWGGVGITHFDQESFFQNIPREAIQCIIFNMLVGLLPLATYHIDIYCTYCIYTYTVYTWDHVHDINFMQISRKTHHLHIWGHLQKNTIFFFERRSTPIFSSIKTTATKSQPGWRPWRALERSRNLSSRVPSQTCLVYCWWF